MTLINKDNISIVDSFIRLYGESLEKLAPHYTRSIIFRQLPPSQNDYDDIMGRIGNTIYISHEEVDRIGLTSSEILASIAHEIGHVVYSTRGWDPDCEQRADSFAADLGLGSQMISAIEKILESRRFQKLTSSLVNRIHFLQNMLRG